MKYVITILLLCGSALAQRPVLFYSDLVTGMCTGGEDNKGHWVTINGNNFGTPQGAGVVKLGTETIDTYAYWTNTKIAFQLHTAASGCQANGAYNLTVVTPSGTSNALSFSLYSTANVPTAAIYFFDSASGNDSTGSGTKASPYKTTAKCATLLAGGSGITCYLLPNYWGKTVDSVAYLRMGDIHGSSTAWNAVIGYPTTNSSQVPKIGCYDLVSGCELLGNSLGTYTGTKIYRSTYLVIANLGTYAWYDINGDAGHPASSYAPIDMGANGAYPWHHVRLINIDIRGGGYTTATAHTFGSYLWMYGINIHDIDDNYASKHSGGIYIGDSLHDIDVGWSTVDFSCATAGTCHTNKAVELHSTKGLIQMGAPTLPALSKGGGGSLTEGTYDVYVSYRSRQYYNSHVPDPVNCYNLGTCNSQATETALSSVQKVTLIGPTETSITVNAPAGFDSIAGFGANPNGDGVSVLCNPALAYRVFACKESACTSADIKLQGESTYSTPTAPGSSTAANFTINSLNTGSTAYQSPVGLGNSPAAGQLFVTDISGCNEYNVAVHDSKFYDAPGYTWTIANPGTEKGYISFYNNEVVNSGNSANWIMGSDSSANLPTSIDILDPNGDDGRDRAEAGTISFLNNIFYNSGTPNATYSSILSMDWHNASYPTRTLLFRNNIMVQPQNGQAWLDPFSSQPAANLVIDGDYNLCYAYSGGDCRSPVDFNSGGHGQHASAGFTANGSSYSPAAGSQTVGLVYSGYNVKPAVGSAAIDHGTDTSASGVTQDILGVSRPQNAVFDIGNHEYISASVGSSVSGAILKGVTIK